MGSLRLILSKVCGWVLGTYCSVTQDMVVIDEDWLGTSQISQR